MVTFTSEKAFVVTPLKTPIPILSGEEWGSFKEQLTLNDRLLLLGALYSDASLSTGKGPTLSLKQLRWSLNSIVKFLEQLGHLGTPRICTVNPHKKLSGCGLTLPAKLKFTVRPAYASLWSEVYTLREGLWSKDYSSEFFTSYLVQPLGLLFALFGDGYRAYDKNIFRTRGVALSTRLTQDQALILQSAFDGVGIAPTISRLGDNQYILYWGRRGSYLKLLEYIHPYIKDCPLLLLKMYSSQEAEEAFADQKELLDSVRAAIAIRRADSGSFNTNHLLGWGAPSPNYSVESFYNLNWDYLNVSASKLAVLCPLEILKVS